ncbi:MAG: alpha/beta fold hydrolase [Pseudomonadota bacterium]
MATRSTAMRRRFIDGRHGQLLLHEFGPRGDETRPPLLCLHPMPYSGAFFRTIAPRLADGRRVIALDFPGYGQSDALPKPPEIADFRQAALAVLDWIDGSAPSDLLGFHTGCLVGADAAIAAPKRVRRLVLVDVPYFPGDKAAAMLARMGDHVVLTPELDCLAPHWDSDVAGRLNDMPIERAFELFVEHIGARGQPADGFRAAFRYAVATKFPKIDVPTLVVATESSLLDATRAAAAMILGGKLVEHPEIDRAVFELGAATIAATTDTYLTDD